MRKILFYKRLNEKVRASVVNLACFFLIALLTGACASEYKKQTSFEIPPPPSPGEVSVPDPNETGQVSAKGELGNDVTELERIPTLPAHPANIESENVETNDDQEIVCRTMKVTGSRIGRKKICATKAEWALWAKAQRAEAEETIRDLKEASGVNTDSGPDSMGGRSSAPMR